MKWNINVANISQCLFSTKKKRENIFSKVNVPKYVYVDIVT